MLPWPTVPNLRKPSGKVSQGTGHVTDNEKLSFVELNRRIESSPDVSLRRVRRPRLARWTFAIGIAAALVGYGCQWLSVAPATKLAVIGSLLVLEIVALGTHLLLTWSVTFSPTPVRDFAVELDAGIPHYFVILNWLKSQPSDVLTRHAAVARYRKERIESRTPLMFGNIQNLGLLPVLVAVYLQVREVTAGRHIGLAEFVVAAAIAGLYFASWLTSLVKGRLDSMDALLQEALLEVTPTVPVDAISPAARPCT